MSLLHSLPVEPNHPVYPFLQHMVIRGHLSAPFLSSLPLSEKEIKSCLNSLSKKSQKLSQAEQAKLKSLRKSFFPKEQKLPSLLRYQRQSQKVEGTLQFVNYAQYQDSLPQSSSRWLGTFSANVKGQFQEGLEFLSYVAISQERSSLKKFNERYDPLYGLPYNTPDQRREEGSLSFNNATFDSFRALLSFERKFWAFDFGNDWNQWGPGIWQHSTLAQNSYFWIQDSLNIDTSATSKPLYNPALLGKGYRDGYRFPGESAPMTQIRLKSNWKNFYYTKFLAKKVGLTQDSSGFLTGHRLEVKLGSFMLGISEILSYNRETVNWTYLIPLAPFFFAEHQLGDRDNTALSWDIQYYFMNRARVFGELFMDDLLSPSDIAKNYWGNKYAYTLGTEVHDIGAEMSKLQLEYSRVEPWVYTHHTKNNQLQHFGSLLGSSLPPNSHAFHARWSKYFLFNLNVDFEYGFFQHQYLARGSSVLDIHQITDPTTKEFLGENTETRHQYGISTTYSPIRLFELQLYSKFETIKNWKSNPDKNPDLFSVGAIVKLQY